MASQIAAGEVIERPASVVRELMDNSIDAGATSIIVAIEKGGKRLIRVRDNGVGMERDDLLLCVERHATSKIHDLSDLFSIRSLGFRGEALPSISSVSRMEIVSRPADHLIGHRLRIDGGRVRSVDEVGSPTGTAVEIKDLFFNTPARKKFLRTEKTEENHIVEAFSRVSLPFSQIDFRLENAGQIVLSLPASDNQLNRLSVLLGRDVASAMEEVSWERGGITVKAFLSPPDLSRGKGDHVLVYVNRRNVRDRLLTRAIMEGYAGRLMKGRYPQVAIFLEIEPSLVDFNVHPAKQEVRFREAMEVYQAVASSVERTLREKSRTIFHAGYIQGEESKSASLKPPFAAEQVLAYGLSEEEGSALEARPLPHKAETKNLFEHAPEVVGQLKDTYILYETEDGLLMMDQHACHERVLYEGLKGLYRSGSVESQSFLIPLRVELSLKESRLILERLDHLMRLGLEIEHFGGTTFLLRSAPPILSRVKWEEFLPELVQAFEEGDLGSEKVLDRVLTTMACHGAIRAGERLSQREMALLWSQLEASDSPPHCPHGRPVFRLISYRELEKMFGRM